MESDIAHLINLLNWRCFTEPSTNQRECVGHLPKKTRVSRKVEREKVQKSEILALPSFMRSGGTVPFFILKFIVLLNDWNHAFPLSPIHRITGCLAARTIKLQPHSNEWI
jgi:hypothetical protein